MKKLISLFLAVILVLSMAACSSKPSTEPQNSEPSTEASTEPSTEVPADPPSNIPSNNTDTEPSETVNIPEYSLDDSLNLSDSVLDGQLAIEGAVYQMPIPVSELNANGWSHNHADAVLHPGEFAMVSFSMGDLEFTTKVINEYAVSKTVGECHVVALFFGPQTSDVAYYYSKGGQLVNVQFSSLVNISTTKAELIAALGPQEDSGLSGYMSWYGDDPKYVNPGWYFSARYNADGSLYEFHVEYLPADFQP